MIFSGIIGYLFRKFAYEGAPLILAFVLGPLFELNLRQSLLLSKGSFLIFFTRPISAVAVTVSILLLFTSFIPYFRRAKRKYESSTKDD
jgi:putative tricarboxylic transport membrane protein